MVDNNLLDKMNAAYCILEKKRDEVIVSLKEAMLEATFGWYNGHYHRSEDGNWQMESYPIPVISIKVLCDIEIGFEQISVSTKLKREQALMHTFDGIKDYSFETYGVKDYLCDFYLPGRTIQDMKEKIEKSHEAEIRFSFAFPFHIYGSQLLLLIELLKKEEFYY